jgi:hypothetical protein
MRRTLLLVAIVTALATSIWAAVQARLAAPGEVVAVPSELDCGTLLPGSVFTAQCNLLNRTQTRVRLLRVESSCHCTGTVVTAHSLTPNATCIVRTTWELPDQCGPAKALIAVTYVDEMGRIGIVPVRLRAVVASKGATKSSPVLGAAQGRSQPLGSASDCAWWLQLVLRHKGAVARLVCWRTLTRRVVVPRAGFLFGC